MDSSRDIFLDNYIVISFGRDHWIISIFVLFVGILGVWDNDFVGVNGPRRSIIINLHLMWMGFKWIHSSSTFRWQKVFEWLSLFVTYRTSCLQIMVLNRIASFSKKVCIHIYLTFYPLWSSMAADIVHLLLFLLQIRCQINVSSFEYFRDLLIESIWSFFSNMGLEMLR